MAVIRNRSGQFAKGWSGGPGRPKGKRNYLTELFLEKFGNDFALHGDAVIADVRQTKPHLYLACAASLCPKQMQVERRGPFDEISDDELAQLEEHLAMLRARTVRELERNGAAVEVVPGSNTDPD